MDISNKALAMFLLAAIVVSLGGTIISLNKLGGVSTTGYATTGKVNLSVQGVVSITTNESSLVDFGSCTPFSGVEAVINSEDTENTSTVCTSFTATNITVRNDGNRNANVTIQTNVVGNGTTTSGTFLASASAKSEIAYKTVNAAQSGFGYTAGCTGSVQTNYANMTAINTEYPACDNLTYGPVANTFLTNFQIIVPYDAPATAASATITYTATERT